MDDKKTYIIIDALNGIKKSLDVLIKLKLYELNSVDTKCGGKHLATKLLAIKNEICITAEDVKDVLND